MSTERERFDEWYSSAVWGNEDYKDSLFRVWQAQAAIIADLQQQLTEANRQTGMLGNAIQKAKFELSFAGKDPQVKAAQDALNSVYEIQHPELATATSKRGG